MIARPLAGITLLFVDDDDDTLEVMGLCLRHAGATVLLADSGPRAMEILRSRGVDVIVSDISMPGMSGIEMLKTIRGWPSQVQMPTPAIAVTAFPQYRAETADVGYAACITKPSDPDDLIAAIRRLAA